MTGPEHKSAISHNLFSPSRESLFSPPRESQMAAVKLEGGVCVKFVGDIIPEEGLLGQAAANSRDMPILAAGGADSRDGLCAGEMSRDMHCILMCDDNNSMHAMLENSRHGTLDVHSRHACSSVQGTAEAHAVASSRHSILATTPIHHRSFEDSQVCTHEGGKIFQASLCLCACARVCERERESVCANTSSTNPTHGALFFVLPRHSSSGCCRATTRCLAPTAVMHLE